MSRLAKSSMLINSDRSPELVPMNQLIHEGGGRWTSVGSDPQFAFELNGEVLAAGWYRVSGMLNIHSGFDVGGPVLYVDYGDGYSEKNKILLCLDGAANQVVDMVINLHAPVRALRFDPMAEPGGFDISGFSFKRIRRAQAVSMMVEKAVQRQPGDSGSARLKLYLRLLKRALKSGRQGASSWLIDNYRGTRERSLDMEYVSWVKRYDSISDMDRETIKLDIENLTIKPLISIVMPTYNTPEIWLRRCIDTVLAQLYPHWELCIADDASPSSHVKRVLEEYAARDNRIKVEIRKENGHISRSSNTALALASGDFVALLDHDDELPEHALYMVAQAINECPDAQLIYSDEDKIDESGRRFDPYFKPEWNADQFRGHNMISHLGVYKRALLQELGGFRIGFEGSQDFDLALRVTEKVRKNQIVHIPHILYHWRAIEGSTARAPSEKNYAHVAAKKALTAHLERIGLDGEVIGLEKFHGNWSFKPALKGDEPKVSIIIPTRDCLKYLRRCIDSILEKTIYENFEIIIVDNQSALPETHEYFHQIVSDRRITVLAYDHPFNYSSLNNFAATKAGGDLLLFLNNDTEIITRAWIREMAAHAMRREVGAVGVMLYYPDDRVQHAGVILGLGAAGIAGHAYHLQPKGYPGQMCRMHLTQELSAVTAACMMVRKSVFEQVGGFDPTLRVAFNDIDLCLRIRKLDLAVLWTPRVELYHHESITRGSDEDPARKARFESECEQFKARWGDLLDKDPHFNPNLRLDRSDFQFGPVRKGYPWQA